MDNNFPITIVDNTLREGEQQRLAFARILVNRPDFSILDEATSALDLINEANLYQQLQQTKTTYISVGHRESLFDYHQWVLELLDESRWQLVPIEDYRLQKINSFNVEQPNSSTTNISGENEPATQVDQSTVATIERPELTPANEYTPTEVAPTTIALSDTTEEDQSPAQTDELAGETPAPALAHDEIKLLCNYAISTIRNKASRGKPITTRDGSIYRYNKDRKVRKWLRE